MQRRVALTLGGTLVLMLVAAGAAGQAAFGSKNSGDPVTTSTTGDDEDLVPAPSRPRGAAYPASTDATFTPPAGAARPAGTTAVLVRGHAEGSMPTAAVTLHVTWSSPTPVVLTSSTTSTTTSTTTTAARPRTTATTASTSTASTTTAEPTSTATTSTGGTTTSASPAHPRPPATATPRG